MNRLYTKGQVVYSKSGRDKLRPFIIYNIEGEYLFLVDGDLRKLEKPKKKKNIHVQICNDIDSSIKQKLDDNLYLTDADIKKALKAYQK